MVRIRKILGLTLTLVTVLSLFPVHALAEEAQPYESVETLGSGVTLYHNKDGTDTLVVESETTNNATNTDPDRLMNSGGYLTNEGSMVDLKIEKEFNEGDTLVTVGIDGASVSFYPLVQDAPAETNESTEEDDEEISSGIIISFVDRKDSSTPIKVISVSSGTMLEDIEFPNSLRVKLESIEETFSLPVKNWHALFGTYGDESGAWQFVPDWDYDAFRLSEALQTDMEGDPSTETDNDPFVIPYVLVEMEAEIPEATETPLPSDTPEAIETPLPSDTPEATLTPPSPDIPEVTETPLPLETSEAVQTPFPTETTEDYTDPELTATKSESGTQTVRLCWQKPTGIVFEETTAEPIEITETATPIQPEVTPTLQQETSEPSEKPAETPNVPETATPESVETENLPEPTWDGPGTVDGRLRGYSEGTYSAVVYEGVFSENTDIELRALQSGVKENVLIGEYTGNHVYAYRMNFNGLTPVLSGRTVKLYSAGKQVGLIDAPYMSDARGSSSTDIAVSLNSIGGGSYELTYTPSDEWLCSDRRVYPVVMDPQVTFTSSSSSSIRNNYVNSAAPNTLYSATASGNVLLVGGTYTGYILPVLNSTLVDDRNKVLILSAGLTANGESSNTNNISAYQVKGNWGEASITYNNSPGYYDTVLDTKLVAFNVFVTWDIAKAFSSWFDAIDTRTNYGIALAGPTQNAVAASTAYHQMKYTVTYYRIDEENTLTATPVENADGTGTVNLTWDAIPNASSYYIGIYNGKEYEYIDVGNVTSWSTNGNGVWPTSEEIAEGRYALHLDGTGGELPASPLNTYKNANASNTSISYYFTVLPANAFGQAANPGFTASAVMPHALVPSQPTSVLVSPNSWTNTDQVSVSWSGVVDYLEDGTELTTLETGGRIEYSVDGITNWQTTGQDTASGTYLFDTSALADGTHTVYIRGVDKDGNEGAPRGAQILIDRTGPTQPSVEAVPEDWTNATSVIISWTGISDLSGISRVDYSADGLSWTDSGSVQDSDVMTLDISTFSEGAHDVRIRAVDLAGNTGEIGETSFYKDSTAPAADSFVANPANWTDGNTVNIAWTNLADAHAGLASLAYSVDGSIYAALDHTLTNGTVEIDASGMADGTHIAVFRYTDYAGNTGSTTVTFYRDTEAPVISLAQPLDGDLVNGIVNISGIVEDRSLSSWTLTAEGTSTLLTVASGTSQVYGALLGVLDTSAFADGEEISLKLTAEDEAGHETIVNGVIVKVDRSLQNIEGKVEISDPINGDILTSADTQGNYSKKYYNSEQTGYVYLDGKLLCEAKYGAFSFSNISLAEGSSHTLSVISEDTEGNIYYSDGMGLYGLGSGAPEAATGTVESGSLSSPKNILALRLTTTQSETTGINYSFSEDNGASWKIMEPDVDVRLVNETKSVMFKAELDGTSILHGWEMSAIVEKSPITLTARLLGDVTSFNITNGDPLTQEPYETITTDLPESGITTYAVYADGSKTNNALEYETLLTSEGASVTISALALDDENKLYGSGTTNVEQLLRTDISESDSTYESGELISAQPIYAIRFLTTTTGGDCSYYYSLNGTDWTSATRGQYLLLEHSTTKLYFRAEQTASAKITGVSLEGVSVTGKNMTVQLLEAPSNVIARDYGKYTDQRYALSWSASASAGTDSKYVVYRNGIQIGTTSSLSYTDYDYQSNAVFTVSLAKTFIAPDVIADHTHFLDRESEKIAAKKVVMTPSSTTSGETNDLIDFSDVDTLRELYGDTYLFTRDMLTPPEADTVSEKTLGRTQYCALGYEPINFNTGNFFLEARDYAQSDLSGTLEILRTYNTQTNVEDGPFGHGWEFAYSQKLELYADGNIGYRAADGALTVFRPNGDGTYFGSDFDRRTLTVDRVNREYQVSEQDKTVYVFSMNLGWLLRAEDKNGNAVRIERTENGYMSAIIAKSGVRLPLTMDENGHITQITLPNGRVLNYAYDNDNLVTYIDALGNETRYEYDELGRMKAWFDAAGTQQVENIYDTSNRVIFQIDAQKGEYTIAYDDGETIMTDALGQTSQIYYDEQFRTTKEIDALGNTTRYYYDEAGNLVGTTDAYEKLTSSEYDEHGNQVKNILPDGSTGVKKYDENNNLTSYTDGNGHTSTYTYDEKGNLLTATGASGGKTLYAYNEKGQMLSATDAAGNTTKYEYDGANLIKMTDALGNATLFEYDALGQVVRSTDALGNMTQYKYDANGNLIAMTLADGAETTYAYDALNNCISATDPLGNVTTYEYDKLSRLVKATFADGTAQTMEYDFNSNIVKVTDALGSVTSAAYDKSGNRISATDTAGSTTTYAYDKLNRIVKETLPTGAFRSYVYNLETGLVDESTDEYGITKKYDYDKAGNLIKYTLENGAVYETEYDAENRTIRQTDPLGSTDSVEYDLSGRMVTATSVLGGTSRFEYDAVGNLIMATDALGNITRMEYDALGRVVRTIDALENETRYAYNAVGDLQTVTDALGNVESYQYDKNGNLSQLTDALGRKMTFGYDALGDMTKAVQKNGAVTVSEYDAAGRLTKQTDALGNATAYTYNAQGLAETITDALGQVARIAYDKLGNPLTITAPNGGVTKYEYAASGQLLSTTDAVGLKTAYAYDNVGNVTELTVNGNATAYTYDLAGNVTSLTDAEGRRAEFTYDAAGNLLTTTYPDGSQSTTEYDLLGRVAKQTPRGSLPTAYEYDAAGNILSVTTGTKVTSYTYDALGNRTQITYPDGTSDVYAYDALGNLIDSTDALGVETQFAYDASSLLSQVTYANDATLLIDYDKAGNILAETDALGTVQTYAYDAVGRMTAVTDALGNVTQYAYDAGDNLTQVTDALGNDTGYTYDLNGNLTSETDALGNTICYSYTPEGWLKEIAKADGETITYEYDKTGNLTKETTSDGAVTVHAYNQIGELVTTTDADGETKYQYNSKGQLSYVVNPTGDVVRYTYDDYGRKTVLTYPDGRTVAYTYDDMDRLVGVKGLDGTKTNYSYDADGRRIETQSDTLTTTYAYDDVGNLTNQETTGKTELTLEYVYDLNNRMTSETRTESGETVKSTYVYDKLGQLTVFTKSDGYSESYSYDSAGNMLEKTVNTQKIAMTYDAANELKTMTASNGTVNYAYDANGNLTQMTLNTYTDTYTYNVKNQLTNYSGYDGYQQRYSYNARGQLTQKQTSGNAERQTLEAIAADGGESAAAATEDGGSDDDPDPDPYASAATNATWQITTYIYDDTAVYYEVLTETTDGITTAYEYGVERISAYTKDSLSTQKTDYVYDGRGSVAQTLTYNSSWYTFGGFLSSKGVNSYTYTPFGELLTGEGAGFRFNGEYYDSATGMLNLRARQYEPGVMRFVQRDLLKGDQAAPLSLNRYLYCENDSVNFVDPSGRSIANLWNKAKATVSNVATRVATTVSKTAKTVATTVTAAAKTVATTVTATAKTVATTVTATAKTVATTVTAAAKTVGNVVSNAVTTVSNSVKQAATVVKSGAINAAAKITSAATTFANNVKTTVSNTRTSVLDWYGRNEETINKCLTTAAIVLGTVAFVALTVASAGAVAAAAGVMFAGTALAGSAATLATIGVYGLATVTALFGASNIGEIWSGYNVIRDMVFGGNQMAYDYAQAGLAVLNMEVMQFGSYNSGLVRTPSTVDDPTDEVVGNSAGEYAGKQATGATQSGNAETTACTSGQGSSGASEWTNPDGSVKWPPNNGFQENPTSITLEPGTIVDRYGGSSGKFVSPIGTSYVERSLPIGSDTRPYNAYQIVKPIEVQSGFVAPWFGQLGGGVQYQFSKTIEELIEQGYIRRIP